MDERHPPVQPPQRRPRTRFPRLVQVPISPRPRFPRHAPAPPPPQPRVVSVPLPSTRSVPWGYLAVAIVGVLALVGFLFLPFVTILRVSVTGVQYATAAKGLWFVAAAGAAALFVGGLGAAYRPTQLWERLVSGGIVELMGIASAAALYQCYAALAAKSSPAIPVTSLLATGFWLCVIASACLMIGGIVVLAGWGD